MKDKKERGEAMVIDEDNFIPELRNGNTRALEYIVDTYSNLIFKVVINVLGGDRREYAKECINDVFLLVWNKINLYDPIKSSFKNWLLAVSKYKAIDYKRALRSQDNADIEEETLYSEENIENKYILKERMSEIFKLLESENKVCREMFIRRYIFDEDTESIAERLNLSKGAVYNRLWRLRNTLAQKLDISYKKEDAE